MANIIEQYNEFLGNLAEELDIPPSKYQQAVDRYAAVGKWLEEGNYESSSGKPLIYPQGSFRLGTVVRPLKNGEESDYDIDLVCELQIRKDQTNPQKIKSLVGNRLMANITYKKMMDSERRRCWTLQYAEEDGIGFHMDILPSIPEDFVSVDTLIKAGVPKDITELAIAITHKDKYKGTYSWRSSNPRGFAEWFDAIKKPMFIRITGAARQKIFESNREIFASVEDVPDQFVKTPLQSAIQILKRHRDTRFLRHALENAKPVSIIITTLSARLYRNEADVYSTLKNIIEKLDAHSRLLVPNQALHESILELRLIEKKADGRWYIPNPVNPAENFADRWHENDHKMARAFFQWVSWVKNDLLEIINQASLKDIGTSLKFLGAHYVESAASKIAQTSTPRVLILSDGKDSHYQIKNPNPPWGMCGK